MRQDEIAKNDLSSYISDCPSINEKQNFKSDPGTTGIIPAGIFSDPGKSDPGSEAC